MTNDSSSYKLMTQQILKDVESNLGVYKALPNSSGTLELLPISKFVEAFKNNWGKMTPEKFTSIKSKCSIYLSSLAYTDAMCNFNRRAVLDFSNHIRVDLLCNLMSIFLKRENISGYAKEDVSGIINYLSLLESRDLRFISSMSYRYIRLFVCFYLIGDYSDCSVIANFIVQQAFVSEGVDNSVRDHLKEIVESRKELNSVHERYTNKNVFTKAKEGAKEAKMIYESFVEKKKHEYEKKEEDKDKEKEQQPQPKEESSKEVEQQPQTKDDEEVKKEKEKDENLKPSNGFKEEVKESEPAEEQSNKEEKEDKEEEKEQVRTSSNNWGIK